jgi:hypothetical protein
LSFSALRIFRGCYEATVAQQAEQLICNQRVGGSIPFGGSRSVTRRGEVPERPKGADCKSAGAAFGGSNPPLSTSKFCDGEFVKGEHSVCHSSLSGILLKERSWTGQHDRRLTEFVTLLRSIMCGSSSVVERQPSKLRVAGSNPVSRSMCPCSSVGRAHPW